MPSEGVRGFQEQLVERGWRPVREIAHVYPMHWRQAYDEGLLRFSDLSRAQQQELLDREAEVVARAAGRELARRACLAAHGQHQWVLSLSGGDLEVGTIASVSCAVCRADSPVPFDEPVYGDLPVSLQQDEDGSWRAVPRVP